MIPTPEPIALTFIDETQKWRLLFDASAYSTSSCSRNVFYNVIKGLSSARKNHKMEYGTAIHVALAHYYTNKRIGQSTEQLQLIQSEACAKAMNHFMNPEIEVPDTDYRTISHLINCLGGYFKHYGNNDVETEVVILNDVPLVEQKFCVPFYTDNLLEVCLTGTIDLVCNTFGQIVLMDHKSTSANGPFYYLQEYTTSTQLMMYAFIFGQLFPTLVDPNYGIGTRINGIFLRKTGNNVMQRSDIIHFYPEQIAAFAAHVKLTIVRIAESFHNWIATNGAEEFLQNFTQCNNKFGCPFKEICTASAIDRTRMIAQNYVLRNYNPLLFQL